MKPSEMNKRAQREFTPPEQDVAAGDLLAGDQFLRPEWQARIEAGDGTLSQLAQAHRAFYDGHKNLRGAVKSKDPEATEDAHFMRTRKLGEAWMKNSGGMADRAMKAAGNEIESERAALQNDLGLVEDHRAPEIRNLLRSMSDQDRDKLLKDAVKAGDARTVAAVVEAPSYLSGMSRDQVASWRRQYEGAHGRERLARIDTLQKAVETVDGTITEAVVFQSKLFPQARVQQIEEKQREAREMQSRLDAV